MVTLTVKESYATLDEADLYFEDTILWLEAEEQTKLDGLIYGRYYIDQNFTCVDPGELDTIPDELKYANSLLALDYISDQTIFDSGANLKRELVQAGSVISENEYFSGASNKPASLGIVRGVLKGICSFSKASTFLIRS